uniref:TMEM131_like domain-containing protein n=1 Tax=Heterorhabditis bacteriophora TaxID=37862 RepID=A0A1I7XH73_HETBA
MEFASNPPIAVHPGKHLQPGKPVDLVKVFFDASRINFETNEPATKHFFGRIIAVSRGGNYNITLPFRAVVYQGDIFSVGNDLALQGDLKIPHKRAVRLKNSLPFGVAVWNISVSPDARQYFTVRLFGKTTVIGSGEERPVFLLKYNKRVPDTFGSAVIYVHTNVSTYRVQMWKYCGKIQVELFSVDQDIFDFGVLERGDSRTIRFVIRNNNRAIMTVRGLKIPNPSIYRLYLVSILAKHHAAVSIPLNMREEWVQGSDLEIPPEHYVILDFELRIPMIGSYEKGQIIIATEFESRVYPINYEIETSAEMIWPRLLTRNSVHFPLTALGNFTVEMNETLMFSLRDTELFTLKPDSPVPRLREELEAAIPQTVPRFTLSLLLKPHMKVRLRLGFLPSDYTLRSSLLLIRNNLTIIEPVVVYGRGAVIGMKVEGTEARSKQPLLFEIRHDHLSDCNNPKRLMHKLSSTLTVRRPFTVSNTGEVPFTVVNMSINGVPCENRGFRILNCYPFRLQPNETYLLDVAYTPDFLTTTNEADLQLYMHMNGSSWLFPLAATVPVDMMARCHRALPRPPFENLMYYSCVTALIFCLVCVLACAYLEGDRAIACAIRQHYTTPRHVFDLNNLDTVKKSAGGTKEGWSQSSSLSGLHASADASVVSRAFYQTANSILKAVHFVWSAKTSMSPKAPAISRTDPVRKKSNVMDTERRLARAQHLMDDFETCSRVKREERPERRREEKTEERRDKQALKPAANVNGTLRDSREFDTTSVTPVSVAELQSRSATIPVSTVQPTVSSLPSVVDVISTSTSLHVPLVFHQQGLEEDYNLSDEFNRPITPTPSLASSIGAERRIYQEYNEDNMTSNHQVSSNSLTNACERRLSESEISIVSELSAAPDWMDEVVGPDDVDDDFSAMAAATEHMMSGSGEEWIPSRSDTPAHTQKKKSRRKRGGRGRHGRQSGSESVSSVDRVTYKNASRGAIGSERGKKQSLGAELQEERRRMVEAYQQRTEGLDELNWPMPDLHLDSLIETDERCQAGSGLWPSVSLCTAASLSTTSPMQWTQSSIQSEMSFDPYSRLGLSLGTSLDSQGGIPYQGTLFSGRDFGLWSEQVVDPAVSWANVHVSEEEK